MSKVVIATCTLILILGLLAGWDVLEQLIARRFSFNLLVLLIPIGIGLFLGKPGARTAAVWLFGLIYLLSAVALIIAWFSGTSMVQLGDMGFEVGTFPAAFVFIAILCSIIGFLHWLLFLPQFEDHLHPVFRGGKPRPL